MFNNKGRVVFMARRKEKLDELAEEIREKGVKCFPVDVGYTAV